MLKATSDFSDFGGAGRGGWAERPAHGALPVGIERRDEAVEVGACGARRGRV